jgi:hypothetical protein
MSQLHDDTHERSLERLATGEPVSQRELEVLRACEVCGRQERELGALQSRLERVGRRRREVLEEAFSAPVPPDARRQLERLVHGRKPEHSRRFPLLVSLAGASVAAGLSLWLWIDNGRPPKEEPATGVGVLLGDPQIEGLSPIGAVASFGLFRFRVEGTPIGWYTIEVFDPADRSSRPLLRSPELDAGPQIHQWSPSEEQQAEFPDAILWRVRFDRGDGSRPLVGRSFSATRLPR